MRGLNLLITLNVTINLFAVDPLNRPQTEAPLLRHSVNLVQVPVTITDRKGRTVTGLTPDRFEVLEDGVAQRIAEFRLENAPLSVGIVMDTSGSMRSKMSQAREAMASFIKNLEARDEVSLITFAGHPAKRIGFTDDPAVIQNALLLESASGSTALFDAIYLGLEQIREGINPRKVLLVISDGEDNNSRFTKSDLISAAREVDVQIYTVAVRDNTRDPRQVNGALFLDELSKTTGGLHVTVFDRSGIPRAIEKIGTAMREQYLIGYYSPRQSAPGKWRRIKVRLQPSSGGSAWRVSARRGYYAPY
ncbi:MAG: VWA domain-containing protein [Bryobacterales bacterium]|nr:VWA domain-containing protein [Bryobacterales bacterium]